MEEFDYNKAISRLEKIAETVENPSTGIDDIEQLVKQSDELIAACREYLRGTKTKVTDL